MLNRLFKPRPAVVAGRSLYRSAAAQARRPEFYAVLGVPDTVQGRFELYALHVVLLLRRLKGRGEQAAETSQAVFDAFLRGLDDSLRDLGVGDLSMGKQMRKLGESVYGRIRSYDAALTALPDESELAAVIARLALAGREEDPAPLTAYAARAAAALEAQPLERLCAGEAAWPSPGASPGASAA